MNNNLQQYLDYIFGLFHGLRANEGGFFIRNIINDRKIDREFRNHIIDVLNVLMQNGIIYSDDPRDSCPFLKISRKGYDFMQGGDLELSNFSLFQHIDPTKSYEDIYNRIWDFIGNEKTAPFYLKGSDFFNVVAPYVGLTSHTYSSYTQERQKQGKGVSRNLWYRELFMNLKPEDLEPFLNDLSKIIIERYQPLYRAQIDLDNEWDGTISVVPSNEISVDKQSPIESNQAATNKEKVIFISYTWESTITSGHKEWVKHLADKLMQDGFDVRLDQYQPLGTEMNHFMSNSVAEADRILLICTPTFKQRSDTMQNACGFEASMISNNLINDITSQKFLPIFRIGEPNECMPNYLGNRNGLIWHANDDDSAKYAELVADLRRI